MVELYERTTFVPDEAAERRWSGSCDPETLKLLRSVLDAAWASLAPEEQGGTTKSDVALRILRLARVGERDRNRLHMAAVIPPGNMVIWRGLSRLTDIKLGAAIGAQIVGN
jgi:hypothetical protein